MLYMMVSALMPYKPIYIPKLPYFILVTTAIVVGIASIYFIGAMTIKYNKIYTSGQQTEDIDSFLVTKLPASDSRKKSYENEYKFARTMAIVCIVCTMILCFFCANTKMIADKYGAYSDFDITMNITSINALSQYNFEDCSNAYVASDQKEKIVVLFKYDDKNNADNKNIKTNILLAIDEIGISNVYFISASSDVGKNIIKNNENIDLPSAMLISENNIIQTESLSDINTISERMNQLIKTQKEMISQ